MYLTTRCLAVFAVICLALPLRSADAEERTKEDEQKLFKEAAEKIVELHNQVREKEKLKPLKLNALLTKAAQGHSENMAKQGKLEHVLDGKSPAERVKAAGYVSSRGGENIASSPGLQVKKICDAWLDSKLHRENILKPIFEEIGIGLDRDKEGEVYYTVVFATPKKKQ